jgi:hypothetical protein
MAESRSPVDFILPSVWGAVKSLITVDDEFM